MPIMPASKSISLLLFSAVVIFSFLRSSSVQGQPTLLKDVNIGSQYTNGSFPGGLIPANGFVFFAASHIEYGRELWKTDGTSQGTQLVKDIAPKESNANISDLTTIGNTLWFSATDQVHGQELWKSDGTEAGTTILDVVPGPFSASPSRLININGTLYFTAQDPEHGRELWKSDGTAGGTVMIKDIVPGEGSGFDVFTLFTVVNSFLLFTVDDGIHGPELWKSDGTEAGTVMVKDITPGSSSSQFFYFTAIEDHLYFLGNDGVHGQELWVSDGTEAGTHMVKDINAGPGSSGASPVVGFQGVIFFTISTQTTFELWKTDGTEAGTVVVNDALPMRDGTHSVLITPSDNKLYFTAGAQQLWTSDGTELGTSLLKQFAPGTQVALLGADGTTLFIGANDGVTGQELWKTDGTESGTVIVKDINSEGASSPWWLVIDGAKIYFNANDGIHGDEVWLSDGTEGGTAMIKDINTRLKYVPTDFRSIGNDLFFINHRSETTYEVWKSNGTTEGTLLVKDINPGAVGFSGGTVQASDDKLFMVLDDGIHGFEVWVSDGTADGTELLKDIRAGTENASVQLASNSAVLNGHLFFQADDGINGHAMWKTDGTEAGTVMVKPIITFGPPYVYSMLPVGNVFFFLTAFALWKSDGTEGGTVMVKEFNSTYNGYNPGNLYNMNGTLYFVATDGMHGLELWKSDGTESGTYMVKDIHEEDTDHFPTILGDINGKLMLGASATGFDYELWMSDGTEAGTVMLKDINSLQGSSPLKLSQNGDFVFFTATDVDHGNELWKTDGTAEGTAMVKDIFPGILSSSVFYSGMYKGNLYFSANDGTHGTELWKTNGTTEGTKLLMDIRAGGASSVPFYFTATEKFLYFSADDGTHGREPWVLETVPQIITFLPLADKVANDSPFALEAVASSGLPVSFSVVSGPATISGNLVTLTGSGEVVVRGSQPGDDDTDPAPDVERSFHVAKAMQIISFEPLASKKTDDPPFEVTAVSSSGLPAFFSIVSGPATISQSTVSITGAGDVTVKASQPGNEIYSAAEDVLQSFVVELVVGLEETRSHTVSAYPNPASDVLYINISEGISSVKLFNHSGQTVWESEKALDVTNVTIDTDDLLPGIYLLTIQQKDKVFFKKIIID